MSGRPYSEGERPESQVPPSYLRIKKDEKEGGRRRSRRSASVAKEIRERGSVQSCSRSASPLKEVLAYPRHKRSPLRKGKGEDKRKGEAKMRSRNGYSDSFLEGGGAGTS